MKKVLTSFVVLGLLFFVVSCKQDTEKNIIGTWENTETEVSKLDEVADALFKANKNYLEQQKIMYEAQLDSMDDSSKVVYEQIVANIDEQISNLSIDTIKNNIVSNYNIGTFVFKQDSSLVIKNGEDSVVGSWSITGDEEKTLNIKVQEDEIPLVITDMSKNTMTISQTTSIDSLEFDIIYTFEK